MVHGGYRRTGHSAEERESHVSNVPPVRTNTNTGASLGDVAGHVATTAVAGWGSVPPPAPPKAL